MRERPTRSRLRVAVVRITPAYAGKTLENPNKIAISMKETVKFHLLSKQPLR